MRRRKVLIVDDEETIVLGLTRVLYRDNDRYDVLMARDAEIAQQILVENAIDVMVTDVRLPGMSGLDLLTWACAEGLNTRVIVITAFDTAGLQERAYRFGCLKIVQKPFDVHAMREMVLTTLDNQDSFSGSLTNLSPADVIQMLCLGQKSTGLRVGDGANYGMVHIADGDVVHAVWDDDVGEAAFYEILRATSGMFSTIPLPEDGPRTIDRDWQHLLLDGMRLEDERRAGIVNEPEVGDLFEESSGSAQSPKPAPKPKPKPKPKKSVEPEPDRRARESEAQQDKREEGSSPEGSVADEVLASVRDQPRDVQVAQLVDRGFSFLRDHMIESACEVWQRAQQMDPGNRMIELNLRKLDKIRGVS